MGTAQAIEGRHTVPTAVELEYFLHNSFDESCPPGWGDTAVQQVHAAWAEEDARQEGETHRISIFWSRVFVTFIVLLASAWIAMNQH